MNDLVRTIQRQISVIIISVSLRVCVCLLHVTASITARRGFIAGSTTSINNCRVSVCLCLCVVCDQYATQISTSFDVEPGAATWTHADLSLYTSYHRSSC